MDTAASVDSAHHPEARDAAPTGSYIRTEERVADSLEQLAGLVEDSGPVYLRYSCGFAADRTSTSRDGESGLTLPGLSVNPLTPEDWWTRPLEDWLARQICQYRHLAEQEERHAWILSGLPVGRGPDCEPLLTDVVPLGRISDRLLCEAGQVYDERFDAGNQP
ncbi:DUF6098 family protein [Arthrobacter sp. CP30]